MNAVEARLLDGFAQDSPRRTAGSLNRAIGLIRRKTRIRQTRSHRLHFAVWRHSLLHPERSAGLAVEALMAPRPGGTKLTPSLPDDAPLAPTVRISGRRWVGSPSCKLFRHGGMRETSVYLARFPMPSRLPMRANPVQRPCTTSPYPVLCSISPIPPTGSRILL